MDSPLYSYSYSYFGKALNGGNILISAPNGNISGVTSLVSASISNSFTSSAGGKVTLEAKNQINNMEILTQSSNGQAGIVEINGLGDLEINSVEISTSKTVNIVLPAPIYGTISFDVGTNGNSGNVNVTGLGSLNFNKTIINSATQGTEPAGNIFVTSPSTIIFQNGSQILSNTSSSGLAGSITIKADKEVSILDKSELNAQTSNSGKAGNITINTQLLNLDGTAQITTTATKNSTNTDGGGSITLNASQMNLFGTVGIFAETQGVSRAGTLKLNPFSNQQTLNIALTPNSAISALTTASGFGGDIFLTAPQTIDIAGNGKITVETLGTGKAGSIAFSTQNLNLSDGVLISASTSGTGKAGDIFVNAQNFSISNGAKLLTTTSGFGDAGTMDIRVVDKFTITGANTGLFANTELNSVGHGGDILIDPQLLTIQDGAKIAVGSVGAGIGGNIDIFANNLTLYRNGTITAETASTDGGNITLTVPDLLLMRYNSLISTTAGTALAGGNGGNIDINGKLLVGIKGENSDIFANAYTGNGGKVTVNTEGLIGLEYRPVPTEFSDITGNSVLGVQGEVTVTGKTAKPTNLPVDVQDASRLIVPVCLADKRGSSFTITGKGGIAAKPSDRPSPNALDNLGTISAQTANLTTSPNVSTTTGDRIVEATGWMRNAQNQIVLIAGETPSQTKIACP